MNNVQIKLCFNNKEDYAVYCKDTNIITINLNNSHDIKTNVLLYYTLIIHEYTHVSRYSKNFKTKYIYPPPAYEYFLDPEEMLAFYNQILLESIIRKTSFTKCVVYYITNYLNKNNAAEKITKRFYNGIHTLYAKNAGRFIHMNTDSLRSLENFDNDMNIWMGSIARAAMGVPPEEREAFIAEKRRQLDLMRLDIIKKLEDYENENKNKL